MLKIRLLRKEQKISQQKLADYLGITQATLSGWETGKYEIDNVNLSKIADYFGVTTDYLLDRVEEPGLPFIIPEDLKGVRVAFHRGEFEGLTQDEVDMLALIAKSLKERRGAPELGADQ